VGPEGSFYTARVCGSIPDLDAILLSVHSHRLWFAPLVIALVSELEAADLRAECIAKALSAEQLNWQPRHGAWSVAQCLEHLYIANEIYLPAVSAA
jgi:hypothetical protein